MAIGQNLKSLKSTNRSSLLYLLNERGKLSRKDIAAALGLTPAAVTKISQELIQEGYIFEAEAVKDGQKGRSEVLLCLQLNNRYVLGISSDKDSISFSISSLDGTLVDIKTVDFIQDVNAVIDMASNYLDSIGYRGKIDGVGVCIVGSSKGFGIWDLTNLKERLEAKLGCEAIIHNNVRSFAIAGTLYESKDRDNKALYFKWGPGIGSAIVNDGQVLSAGDRGVSEIGHFIVNPNGQKCRCGRRGCLETEVALDRNSQKSVIYDKIKLAAMALMNTATILNTEEIVLFGSVFMEEDIAKKFIQECLDINPYLTDKNIRVSKLNDKVAYIGATAICARRLFFEKK